MNKIKPLATALLAISLVLLPMARSHGQLVLAEVLRLAIKRVVKAFDLKVQRLQNETIWLQNAQKVLENALSKLKLQEISEWTQKQKEQYQVYFNELRTIREVIARYRRIQQIVKMQSDLLTEYQQAWKRFSSDPNFSHKELMEMERMYEGMLDKGLDNLEAVLQVIRPFNLEMTDQQRMEGIDRAARAMAAVLSDLRAFGRQNVLLSLERSKDEAQRKAVQILYGIGNN